MMILTLFFFFSFFISGDGIFPSPEKLIGITSGAQLSDRTGFIGDIFASAGRIYTMKVLYYKPNLQNSSLNVYSSYIRIGIGYGHRFKDFAIGTRFFLFLLTQVITEKNESITMKTPVRYNSSGMLFFVGHYYYNYLFSLGVEYNRIIQKPGFYFELRRVLI